MDRNTKRYLEDILNTNGSINNRGAEDFARNNINNALNQEIYSGRMDRDTCRYLGDVLNVNNSVANGGTADYARRHMGNALNREVWKKKNK